MALERTLSIVKPDGVAAQSDRRGLSPLRERRACASSPRACCGSRSEQAELFYEVHRERPFYSDLVRYMTSGPVIAQVLEGENADREATATSWAPPTRRRPRPGTIRADLAESIEAERGARLGRAGHRGARDRVLLQRHGDLSRAPE